MQLDQLEPHLQILGMLCTGGVLLACSSLPGATSGKPPQFLKPTSGASLSSCEALVRSLQLSHTRLESASSLEAGNLKQCDKAVPAHCLVKGRMHERKGSDGRDYAIGFEMRLPVVWNGRFYYQGNGGLDGAVVPALGALGGGPLTGALIQGFAVISSDAGHNGPQTPFFGWSRRRGTASRAGQCAWRGQRGRCEHRTASRLVCTAHPSAVRLPHGGHLQRQRFGRRRQQLQLQVMLTAF